MGILTLGRKDTGYKDIASYIFTIGKTLNGICLPMVPFLPLEKTTNARIVQGFTNGTIGNAIGTNGTNVTNIRQQIVQTEYSVGYSTNGGNVT